MLPHGILGDKVNGFTSLHRFYVDGSSYGGLLGSVEDAARFLQVHLNGGELNGRKILSPEMVTLMQKIDKRGKKLDVGLGWFRRHSGAGDGQFVEHLGGGIGFFNIMRLYPEESLGIVVMGNATKYDQEAIVRILREKWRRR
jgi:CubicO group peptidase (beta-lactamase class C family)